MSLGGAASAIGGANLLAWYGAILSEPERRFVAPRVMGITQGLGAALLLPVALGVQAGLATIGLADLRRGLRRRRAWPGSASSPRSSACAAPAGCASRAAASGRRSSPETRSFIRIVDPRRGRRRLRARTSRSTRSASSARRPGFAILLSAVSAAASLVAATVVGGLLNRGSASRTLRLSFVLRGGGILLGAAGVPRQPARLARAPRASR